MSLQPDGRLGFHCSHEQHAPSALLQLAREAGAAGFRAAMCSDHFHPWSERHGQSGFAWSWLGAALEATAMSFGTVCAPGQRYHPAVIAQAAATLAEMYPGRFWLALGSGEALNESITGEPWPDKPVRQARLRECAEILRALWAGETVTHEGHVSVREACLHSRPAAPPPLVGAALTPATARLVGGWADALVTVSGSRDGMQAVIDAFRDGGGGDKPLILQVPLAFAASEEQARRAARDQWPQAVLSPRELADLPTPACFDAATAPVDDADLARRIRVSSDIAQHLVWLQEDLAMGFSRVYVHNVVREAQHLFLDACATILLPALDGRAASIGRSDASLRTFSPGIARRD
jgi:coenzyme F420-dependent glucose-6-phosphate dehydrogenase